MMYRRILLALAVMMIACGTMAQSKAQKPLPDTTGIANIESRLNDFKDIVKSMTDNINKSNNIDSIKIFAGVMMSISDTLMNHIAPIMDGFNALHAEQVAPLKNISDLSERITSAKTPQKAKKLNTKIVIEYTNLGKATK